MPELVILTPEQLSALVREAVRAELGPRRDDAPIALASTGQPVRTLRAAIRRGELEAVRVGREYRVRPSALAAWLEDRRVAPEAKPERESTAAERAIARARLEGGLRAIAGGRS
ncbi:MAG: hypothetical protein AMXMBFR56_29270 [Polyangiaceae bacterium]